MSQVEGFNSEVLEDGRIVVYRSHFARLLSYPKPLRDQLVIELPTLEAFRSGEVSCLRVEDVDFEHGDLKVFDSKKRRFYPIPLDHTVAEHMAEYIQREGLTEGLLIRPLIQAKKRKVGSKTKGVGLSICHLNRIWERWCKAVEIPVMPTRVGRAYFAAKWHFIEKKSLYGLMAIMRHTKLEVTERYLARICDYLSVKSEFYQGMLSPFVSGCTRAQSCPVACEGCHCRFYLAQEQTPEVSQGLVTVTY